MNEELDELLRELYLFSSLNNKEINELLQLSMLKEFKKGSILFFEGEKPKSLAILIDGILKIYKTDQKGNKVVLHRFYPVDIVAELVNLEHMSYPATAEFETDGKVLMINYGAFEDKFLKNPDVSFALIKSLSKKIKYLEKVISTNLTLDSTARVAKFICELGTDRVKLKKNVIASELNITPETLSRILKKFSTLQFIKKEKDEIVILDKTSLMVFYQ